MFERFTDRARRVVVLAQEEARLRHHDYIGRNHLLMAMLQEGEGLPAQALNSVGLHLPHARTWMTDGDANPGFGHIAFTPAAKKSIQNAFHEALSDNVNYIGAEHLFRGWLRYAIESLNPTPAPMSWTMDIGEPGPDEKPAFTNIVFPTHTADEFKRAVKDAVIEGSKADGGWDISLRGGE